MQEMNADKSPNARLLTERQAAESAQVDRRTLRRLIDTGRLRALDLGNGRRRCIRIHADDLKNIQPPPLVSMPPRPARRRRNQNASVSHLAAFYPNA
jgi:excisionase family DNA binding protein